MSGYRIKSIPTYTTVCLGPSLGVLQTKHSLLCLVYFMAVYVLFAGHKTVVYVYWQCTAKTSFSHAPYSGHFSKLSGMVQKVSKTPLIWHTLG